MVNGITSTATAAEAIPISSAWPNTTLSATTPATQASAPAATAAAKPTMVAPWDWPHSTTSPESTTLATVKRLVASQAAAGSVVHQGSLGDFSDHTDTLEVEVSGDAAPLAARLAAAGFRQRPIVWVSLVRRCCTLAERRPTD